MSLLGCSFLGRIARTGGQSDRRFVFEQPPPKFSGRPFSSVSARGCEWLISSAIFLYRRRPPCTELSFFRLGGFCSRRIHSCRQGEREFPRRRVRPIIFSRRYC